MTKDERKRGKSLGGSKRKEFEGLVFPELDTLYRVAIRLTGDRSSAEDLLQETLLRAYRAFEKFKLTNIGVKPWLFKIMHNIYFNEKLAEKRKHRFEKELAEESRGTPRYQQSDQNLSLQEIDLDNIPWDQFDQEIKKHIEELPPEYRIVLLLWALKDLSYKEIADICNVPIGTVMSRLYRARQILTNTLSEYAKSHRIIKKEGKGG